MKSDEIYRQKPIDKQNYGFSQKPKFFLSFFISTSRPTIVKESMIAGKYFVKLKLSFYVSRSSCLFFPHYQ